MTPEEFKKHHNDVLSFIREISYRRNSIDKKKIMQVKKFIGKSSSEIEVSVDIITYTKLMNIRIHTFESNLTKDYTEIKIHKDSITLTAPKLIQSMIRTYNSMNEYLKDNYYIDYISYKRNMAKDKTGNTENNIQKVYELQTRLVRANLDYLLECYRLLPKVLQIVKKEKENESN